MSDSRTTVTEIATALGILNTPKSGISNKNLPPIVGVDQTAWDPTVQAAKGGLHHELFERAYENGLHFFSAEDALRSRIPKIVQWKGPHKNVGDEATPADLRIDHVYLVSCKYNSDVLLNSSPSNLFDRLLAGVQGRRSSLNWYHESAPDEYQNYYETAVSLIGGTDFPDSVLDLEKPHREALKVVASLKTSPELDLAWRLFHERVSDVSAQKWEAQMKAQAPGGARMLWRLLRIGSAPYFVLGEAKDGPKRIRVTTPWDWNQRYELKSFHISPGSSGQPTVIWKATFDDRMTQIHGTVSGHVEIRWSHGKFGGAPEAKVYLDSPAQSVPGYFNLV